MPIKIVKVAIRFTCNDVKYSFRVDSDGMASHLEGTPAVRVIFFVKLGLLLN